MKRRSRPSKALMGRQLKEATERHEAAQSKAAAKFAAEAQRLQPLTWAEAQRTVEFIIDGKIRRHDIYKPLTIERIDSAQSPEKDDIDRSDVKEQVTTNTPGRPRKHPAKGKVARTSKNSKSKQKNLPQRIPVPEAKFEEINDFVKVAPRKGWRSATYFKFDPEVYSLDKVEYDLDDQDGLWLKALNERRRSDRLPMVSESVFEAIIDKFEKAAHFEDQTSGRLNETGVDEDAVCSICLDGDCLNANAILFCDMCNLAVHQECYGVPYIPEGQWLCRRCLESPSVPVSCCLCPNRGGAFKRTDDGRWAHVVCALWIPEVSFSNTVFLEPIEGINNIPAARWRLKCYLCKKNGVGAAIQCHRQHCYSAFHVTCAIQAGLFMRIAASPASEDRIKRTAYCDTHAPPNSDALPMISHGTSDGERSSSNSPNAVGRLMKKRQKIRQARKLHAQQQIVNTQVVINVPIISDDSFREISQQYTRLAAKSDLMRQVLAYWKLKRRSRCGVPLIRRLHVSASTGGSDLLKENPGAGDDDTVQPCTLNLADLVNSSDPYIQEHVDQLRTFRLLRQNLERVRLLIELVHKRERMKRDIQKLSLVAVDHHLSPFNMVLRSLLGKLRSLDRRDLFETPAPARLPVKKPMCFSKIEEKLEADGYSTIEDFERDFMLIVDNSINSNPKTTTLYKCGLELKNAAVPVFSEAKQYIESAEFDTDTGMYVSTLQSVPAVPSPKESSQSSSQKSSPLSTSPTIAAAERRRSAALKNEVKQEDQQVVEDNKETKTTPESPPPRTRRNVAKFCSPNTLDELLPQWARDSMPLEEQLSILTHDLEAAARTGKTSIASQIRREISQIKRKINGGSSSGSEKPSPVSSKSSPVQVKDETQSEKISPMQISTPPTSSSPQNGLLMIANGHQSPMSHPVVAASTPLVATDGNSPKQSRISTRRSAAQAGIQLPSVFEATPPPYKQPRRVSSTSKRNGSPGLHNGTRVGNSSSNLMNGSSLRCSPSLQRHSSSLNGTHLNGDDSTPTSPPSTPGVNRRTAVLFQGKQRRPMPTSITSPSRKVANSTQSSPTRSISVASVTSNGHMVNGGVSPGGTLADKNQQQSDHDVNHDLASGKTLRRVSSSCESFRHSSPLAVLPLSEFAVSAEKRSPTSSGSTITVPRRLSPRISNSNMSFCNDTPSAIELSDEDEELLAALRLQRRSESTKNSPALSIAIRRRRRSSTASGITTTPYHPKQFDVVWVRTGLSCPGVAIDPSLFDGTTHSVCKNGLSLVALFKRLLPTMPSEELLNSKPTLDSAVWLVFHFDSKQSWRWVSVDKLEPLDASISVNDLHLPPVIQDSYRRACIIAEKLAIHSCSAHSSRSASPT